jgi:isoleucyl-tRNA synthetase
MLTEDYKEIVHKAIYFELPIEDHDREFLLVWTTTPWTIPANIAVAVDEKLDYSLVEGTTDDKFWLAKERVEAVFGKDGKTLKTVKGKKLVGLKYKGPFDDLLEVAKVSDNKLFHTVIATDDRIMPITTSEGTGLVHTAVSAGAEDFKLGKKLGLPMIPVIADNADYLEGLDFLSGQNAKKHPEIIIDFLGKDWIFKIENYKHRYPACWRCKTELVWKVADEWYIEMDSPSKSKLQSQNSNLTLRERMVKVAKEVKWIPEFGLERELDWLKNMHDWLISKPNRYWGLALPIYECVKCGHFEVIGSREELEKRAVLGWGRFEGHTPHKPWIDEVKIKCAECGEVVARVPDVGNVWLDAGIVPFSTVKENNQGEPLYLKDRKKWLKWFPANFVTESFPGQFKNWFYSLIAMSTVLENANPFKTVLGFATLLAEDGRPMHKSWGNSIEFNEGVDKIGADVMRWMYLRSNPTENMLFGYKLADEVRRQFHLKLWNVYNFFITYANLDGWQASRTDKKSEYILDRWIISRLNGTLQITTDALDNFQSQTASLSIEQFLDDLSNWYIRRSRDYVGPSATDESDKQSFYTTTYEVLVKISRMLAPFNPYISDDMYGNLTKEESVHFSEWPKVEGEQINKVLEEEMLLARKVIEMASAQRKEAGIRVRQPLSKLKIKLEKDMVRPSKDMDFLFMDELNIKDVEFVENAAKLSVELDTTITPELQKEGEAREIVRNIQSERKNLGTTLDQKVNVELPRWPVEFEEEIKKKALIDKLSKGKFKVSPK